MSANRPEQCIPADWHQKTASQPGSWSATQCYTEVMHDPLKAAGPAAIGRRDILGEAFNKNLPGATGFATTESPGG